MAHALKEGAVKKGLNEEFFVSDAATNELLEGFQVAEKEGSLGIFLCDVFPSPP
jgi:hypothetical protein